MKIRNLFCFCLISVALIVGGIGTSFANEYWVSKSGNDTNSCANETTDACLTIQKAISLVGPGDTVSIKRGTYIENSATSLYTSPCIWLDGDPVSLCINADGTESNPIVIQAAPGDEGNVIIDSESRRIGLQTNSHDFIHIKGLSFINNYIIGIASWGQPENSVADPNRLSFGCVIENNYFYNVQGPSGKNKSAIGMWGSKDWIVRNNRIDYVPAGAGIQSYGVINALIENNYITNVGSGIYWKDHFVKDALTREKWFESEIRFNKIQATMFGIQIGIRGTNSTEAGDNYIHHNIFYGFGSSGVVVNMAGAYAISGYARIEHNLFDGRGSSSSSITLDANQEAYISGNIYTRSAVDIELIRYANEEKVVKVVLSDYNIFDSSFKIIADRYSPNTAAKYYSQLSDWRSAKNVDLLTLYTDFPDLHSTTKSHTELFTNADNSEYQYHPSSVAIGFMPDGSNAGPFQFGSEVIGGVRPKAPDPFEVL